MRNFHLLTIPVILCLLCQSSFAQQVYNASHYGNPGTLYLYNRLTDGFSNEDIVQDGEQVIWDLSTNSQLHTHINRIVEPEDAFTLLNFLTICPLSGFTSGECFTIWNNTDQALLVQDTLSLLQFTLVDLQRYQRKVQDQLLENFFGFTVNIMGSSTPAVIVYQNPDTIINFPVTYGNTWTSHSHFDLDLTPAGENVMYTSDQSRTTEIDSWGTIMTPYDTFENVVRLRSDILRYDTVTMDFNPFTFVSNEVEYMWFDTNYMLPVMTANGDVLPGDTIVLNAIEYIYEATCAPPTWTIDIGSDIFYIDASGSATVNFNILQNNANEYTWDFGDGSFAITDGSVSHEYSEPGQYTIAVNGCMTNCLPLNSCAFQILDFEVVDTTTSIQAIAGSELGINLYPNPANDQVNLFIPMDLVKADYEIMDLTGRLIASEQIESGNSTINTSPWSEGTYIIKIKTENLKGQYIAFMRFNVIRE